MEQAHKHDVVIVGGGMVGATLASALARDCGERLSVALVESAPVTADEAPCQPGYDDRSTALSGSSVTALEALGLWSSLAGHAEPIRRIHVSDQGRFGATRLDAGEMGMPALGQVVENPWLGRVFNRHLRSLPGLTLHDRCRVETVTPAADGYHLKLATEAQETVALHTRLLVLAEGGRSGLSGQLGIHRRHKDYDQVALIANVTPSRPHANVAWERFTEQGPVALLPLPSFGRSPRCALIWTHPAREAERLLAEHDATLLTELGEAFGTRLGPFRQIGSRQCWPLKLSVAEEQYRPGLVLLGNVAHSLHPVAGQGFNLALRNALVLSEHIRKAVAQGESPGDPRYLSAFTEAIAADQQRTILFSDQLISLFGASDPLRRGGRHLGLLGLSLLPPLRRGFARHAMGMGGRQAGAGALL